MKIVKRILLVLLSLFFTVVYSNAQTDNLTLKIENVLKEKNARIGVAIFNSNEKDTFKINNDFHFPMQSVMKFPIALAVLSEIDKGNLSFEQKIEITPQDL
ncbi:TPA: serine hydrolase, partial [Aeromonas hydrophila]